MQSTFFPSTARDTVCVIRTWCSSFTTQTPFSSWPSPWFSSTLICTLPTSNPNEKWDLTTSYAIWEVSIFKCSSIRPPVKDSRSLVCCTHWKYYHVVDKLGWLWMQLGLHMWFLPLTVLGEGNIVAWNANKEVKVGGNIYNKLSHQFRYR